MNYSSEHELGFSDRLINSILIFGVLLWGFGVLNGVFFALSDHYLSTVEFSQLFATILFFTSWLHFRPASINPEQLPGRYYPSTAKLNPDSSVYLNTTQTRMAELRRHHMISQEYAFPFPYLCQIYHLLNLKHLENVHGFSLNNLRILKVSDVQPTATGGRIKFQTVLASSINTLRIWRQPIVEVDLILHTPYTVELSIPAYNGKRVIVIFNILPLSTAEHKLFIDIYSDIPCPKPILQVLFHLAACLTVFEDLPYLRRLATKNLQRITHLSAIPKQDTRWLFKRFADLYGANVDRLQGNPIA